MKHLFLLVCSVILLVPEIFGQTDTINEHYFKNLQNILSKDSTIKDIRFVCERYKNGKVKEQHIYVKYTKDSIDRFWRVGKCFHYFENGNLKVTTNIDIVLKKYVGTGVTFDAKGDTTWATFYSNLNGKTFASFTIFKQGDLGRVYELSPDKYMDVFYKKGKRKKARITICKSNYCYTPIKIYYNNDGTVERVEDQTETFEKFHEKEEK